MAKNTYSYFLAMIVHRSLSRERKDTVSLLCVHRFGCGYISTRPRRVSEGRRYGRPTRAHEEKRIDMKGKKNKNEVSPEETSIGEDANEG